MMQVYRTRTKYRMLMRIMPWAFVCLLLITFGLSVAFGKTTPMKLKPEKPPPELAKEAENAVLVIQAPCLRPEGEAFCFVAYDEAADTFWLLIFNTDGVLYKVVTEHKGQEQLRWVHPNLRI